MKTPSGYLLSIIRLIQSMNCKKESFVRIMRLLVSIQTTKSLMMISSGVIFKMITIMMTSSTAKIMR